MPWANRQTFAPVGAELCLNGAQGQLGYLSQCVQAEAAKALLDLPRHGEHIHGKGGQELPYLRRWLVGTARSGAQSGEVGGELTGAHSQAWLQVLGNSPEQPVYEMLRASVGTLQAIQPHVDATKVGGLNGGAPVPKAQ